MTRPGPRLAPLPPGHSPELAGEFASFLKSLGFVPNSVLTMQRKPKLARAFVQMQAALWDADSKVDRGFKRLVAHLASRAARDSPRCSARTSGWIAPSSAARTTASNRSTRHRSCATARASS